MVDYAEFLTRLKPRTGGKARRIRPGEATEHGTRMKLLDLERERRAERAAGIGVLGDADAEPE